MGLEERRGHGPSLVCGEPPNHVQTSTVSNVLIVCKYVEMILRVCLVRTVLINEIMFCMIDDRFLCCATLMWTVSGTMCRFEIIYRISCVI